MARGRPRKPGERKPCGRLRNTNDTGNPMALLRRAELVEPGLAARVRQAIDAGDLDPADAAFRLSLAHEANAGHVLGRMELAGSLTDPELDGSEDGREQSRQRYEALVKFAAEHFALWGSGTAPSHLRNLVTGMGTSSPDSRDDNRLEVLQRRHFQKEAAAMTTPPAGRLLGIDVLRRSALYEMPIDDLRDQETLRRVADRIGAAKRQERFHEGHPELDPKVETAPVGAQPRRHRGLPVEFHAGQVERAPEERATISAAVAKLKRTRVAGQAD